MCISSNEEEAKEVFTTEDTEDFDGHIAYFVKHKCPECLAVLYPFQDRCHECETKLKW